jgi:hypothetical protein
MNDKTNSKRTLCAPLSPAVLVALSAGIGAALAVSNDPATGISLGAGLFVVLWSTRRRA